MAISPDLGEHYLESVYTDEWVQEHYGEGVLAHDELAPSAIVSGDPIALGEG